MQLSVSAVRAEETLTWREQFRREAAGQIVHDSLHTRDGWTESYLFAVDGTPTGYGAVAVGGPWQGTRTVFEFYLIPTPHGQAAELFANFLQASAATHLEFQTSHALLNVLARSSAERLTVEKIVFRDERTTTLPAPAWASFRRALPGDATRMFSHHDEPVGDWLIEVDGVIAATGGMLAHYNPPHRDLFMEVAPSYRRRGLGGYLLQELKRVCREDGGIPCARCNPDNLASQLTLKNAGFVPWAEVVTGSVTQPKT